MAGEAPQGRRVLIIEDNIDAAESLGEVLDLLGHRALLAHTGREGIELARREVPDVVLCDLGLPDMDGLEVAGHLRREETLAATVLVALTGHVQPEDRARALAAGFDRHMAKPVDIDNLEKLLANPR